MNLFYKSSIEPFIKIISFCLNIFVYISILVSWYPFDLIFIAIFNTIMLFTIIVSLNTELVKYIYNEEKVKINNIDFILAVVLLAIYIYKGYFYSSIIILAYISSLISIK